MAAQKIGRASTLSRRRIVGTTPGGKHIAEKNIAEKIMAEQSYCWEEQFRFTGNIKSKSKQQICLQKNY